MARRAPWQQKCIVGKRGGPSDGGVPLREVISCWMDLPLSRLVFPLFMALAPARSAAAIGGCDVPRSHSLSLSPSLHPAADSVFLTLPLLLSLSLPPSLLPQELAARCCFARSLPPALPHARGSRQRHCNEGDEGKEAHRPPFSYSISSSAP